MTKVIICPETKRAYGIEYLYKNEKVARFLRASREVILCAGAIGTPKLLLQSGIGPKKDLENLNIYVIQNLQVGKNLHDHVMFPGITVTLNGGEPPVTPLDVLDDGYEYLTRRGGRFASIGITQMLAFMSADDDDDPDLMFHFQYGRANDTEMIPPFFKGLGMDESLMVQFLEMNAESDLLLPIPILLNPKSRGDITLRSNNPRDFPVITTGYMEDPVDMEYMLMGIRTVERLIKTSAMVAANASLQLLQFDGCCRIAPDSDEYWACALSHLAGTYHDQGGTCKMGPSSDCQAVVDPLLRVYGVKGLRVADLSILPSPVSGPTLATAIMIGEKVSDIIKAQWIPGYVPAQPHNLYPYNLNVSDTSRYGSL